MDRPYNRFVRRKRWRGRGRGRGRGRDSRAAVGNDGKGKQALRAVSLVPNALRFPIHEPLGPPSQLQDPYPMDEEQVKCIEKEDEIRAMFCEDPNNEAISSLYADLTSIYDNRELFRYQQWTETEARLPTLLTCWHRARIPRTSSEEVSLLHSSGHEEYQTQQASSSSPSSSSQTDLSTSLSASRETTCRIPDDNYAAKFVGKCTLPPLYEGDYSVVDEQAFLVRFHKFTNNIFQDFNWENCFMAGGAILACVMADDVAKKSFQGSDLDIFVYGITNPDLATKRLIEIYEDIAAKCGEDRKPQVIRTDRTVTIVGDYPNRHIQIILRLYRGPAEVVFGFDLDACTLGFDGKKVWIADRGIRALNKGYILVNDTRRSLTYEYRLKKYSSRGFVIVVPLLDKKRVDPDLFRRSLKKTQGLGKLLLFEFYHLLMLNKKGGLSRSMAKRIPQSAEEMEKNKFTYFAYDPRSLLATEGVRNNGKKFRFVHGPQSSTFERREVEGEDERDEGSVIALREYCNPVRLEFHRVRVNIPDGHAGSVDADNNLHATEQRKNTRRERKLAFHYMTPLDLKFKMSEFEVAQIVEEEQKKEQRLHKGKTSGKSDPDDINEDGSRKDDDEAGENNPENFSQLNAERKEEFEAMASQHESDYSEVFIPWGPNWFSSNILKMLNFKDRRRFFNQGSTNVTNTEEATAIRKKVYRQHKHFFVSGIEGVVNGGESWCRVCRKKQQNPSTLSHQQIRWVQDCPVYQDFEKGFRRNLMTGSFNLSFYKWDQDVYGRNYADKVEDRGGPFGRNLRADSIFSLRKGITGNGYISSEDRPAQNEDDAQDGGKCEGPELLQISQNMVPERGSYQSVEAVGGLRAIPNKTEKENTEDVSETSPRKTGGKVTFAEFKSKTLDENFDQENTGSRSAEVTENTESRSAEVTENAMVSKLRLSNVLQAPLYKYKYNCVTCGIAFSSPSRLFLHVRASNCPIPELQITTEWKSLIGFQPASNKKEKGKERSARTSKNKGQGESGAKEASMSNKKEEEGSENEEENGESDEDCDQDDTADADAVRKRRKEAYAGLNYRQRQWKYFQEQGYLHDVIVLKRLNVLAETTSKALLLFMVLRMRAVISDDDEAILKNLLFQGDSVLSATLSAFATEVDFEELGDTLNLICALSRKKSRETDKDEPVERIVTDSEEKPAT